MSKSSEEASHRRKIAATGRRHSYARSEAGAASGLREAAASMCHSRTWHARPSSVRGGQAAWHEARLRDLAAYDKYIAEEVAAVVFAIKHTGAASIKSDIKGFSRIVFELKSHFRNTSVKWALQPFGIVFGVQR